MARTPAHEIEAEIERVLLPGTYIGWRESPIFDAGLDLVRARIDALADTEPAEAAALFEAFIAGCVAKAEEVDDDGGYGIFVEDLGQGWIKARQAARAPAEATVSEILAWVRKDEYGFFGHPERWAVGALDGDGLVPCGENLARC